jgi:hypothetical protein
MKIFVRYHGLVFQETSELIPAELINPSGDLSNQQDGIVFIRQGDYWTFGPLGKRNYYKHNKGLEFLHYLMERPDQAVENVALYGGGLLQTGIQPQPDKDQIYRNIEISKRLHREGKEKGFQYVDAPADEQSLREYRKRLQEIMQEKAELERIGRNASDPEWARLDEEFHLLEAEIKRGVDPRGRNQETDRSRKNVSKHIHNALDKISSDFPDLGKYLKDTIQPLKGHQWIYRPGKDTQKWHLK